MLWEKQVYLLLILLKCTVFQENWDSFVIWWKQDSEKKEIIPFILASSFTIVKLISNTIIRKDEYLRMFIIQSFDSQDITSAAIYSQNSQDDTN